MRFFLHGDSLASFPGSLSWNVRSEPQSEQLCKGCRAKARYMISNSLVLLWQLLCTVLGSSTFRELAGWIQSPSSFPGYTPPLPPSLQPIPAGSTLVKKSIRQMVADGCDEVQCRLVSQVVYKRPTNSHKAGGGGVIGVQLSLFFTNIPASWPL